MIDENNESLEINLKNFIDFNYKYLILEETSVINNNHGGYSIVSVNGQCSSYKDDKIEITKILEKIAMIFLKMIQLKIMIIL